MWLLLKSLSYSKVRTYSFLRHFVAMISDKKCSCHTMSRISRTNFITFENMIKARQKEARKTVFIELPTKDYLYTLHSICSKFGVVKNILGARQQMGKMKWFSMVEFAKEDSVDMIIQKSHRNMIRESDYPSILLPFIKLNDDIDKSHHKNVKEDICPIHTEEEKSIADITNHMKLKCSDLSQQIQYFYDETRMTEVGWRLRFLACRKVEWALPRVLSHVNVLPFGSSVNTFGDKDCDVDLVMDFGLDSSSEDVPKNFPFYLQYKKQDITSRNYVQKNLELLAEMISFYMPGFENVTRILNANVPIIKCKEYFTGLDCDISLGNKSGFYMSELLYIYGCSDPRVRPLVFTLRWWAKEKGLTQKGLPGRWLSNFTTTLLVLFFLMGTRGGHVIPPLLLLQKLAGKTFTCEGITYSFLRDVTRLPESSNAQSLSELLKDFFVFYSEFDFRKNAISVITGKTFPKPNFSPLYIQNPVENELNVSRNVVKAELEAFTKECARAVSALEERQRQSENDETWGLLSLVSSSQQEKIKVNKNRRWSFDVDVQSLFEKKKPIAPSFTEKSSLLPKNNSTSKQMNNNNIHSKESNIYSNGSNTLSNESNINSSDSSNSHGKIDRIPSRSKFIKYKF